ncbi:hypothetical protein XMA127_001980 [Marinobacterium sp. xm-a-127]|jgi:hypothetical protein|nr:hypothetical protein [Marinobacterium sp. xm-d-510]NRP98208.1 hypothetical protein [Marinobacterium sp. xm-a-127]
MVGRYSVEATEQKRIKNFERWRAKSVDKWGNAFDYGPASTTYTTQKEPVEIICNEHGHFFTTPSQHLTQKGGGCHQCGKRAKSEARIALHKDSILEWIENELPDHLELLDPYESAGSPTRVRCKRHNTVMQTTVSYLKDNKLHGCEICAREATIAGRRHETEDLIALYQEQLPDHIHIIARDQTAGSFKAQMLCDLHGKFTTNITTLRNGSYMCPECKRRNSGYTSQRLQRLIEEKSRGKSTWLGIMRVNVFGIDSLKVGVTIRSLDERYKWYLKEIYYAVQLDEVTAYTFESMLLEQFYDYRDLRIFKKGMRQGERWSGDTELLYLSQRQKVEDALKNQLEQTVADYETAQRVVDRIEAKLAEVKTDRPKDLANQPKAVVGVNPKTLEIEQRFNTIADASREGFRNVSLALSGHRRQSGGLLWLTAEQIESRDSEAILRNKAKNCSEPNKNGKPVFCVEANIHFHSSTDAARIFAEEGFVVNPSHITSVCRGKRPHAGGFHWQYSDLTHEQIAAISQRHKIPAPTIRVPNAPKKIYAYDCESGSHIGTYDSQSEAARLLGFSGASSISVAIKNGKPSKGIKFYTRPQ